jgi:carbonic anhydrase
MSERDERTLHDAPSRRAFVTTSTAVVVAGLLGACATAETPPAPPAALTKAARDQMTPDQIIAQWKEGNVRFREGRKIQRDFLAEQRATAAGQFPAGCCSAASTRARGRDPSTGMGDIFNARVAGNIENPDILGSMVHHQARRGQGGVVMGHSACGAVAGAIADAKLGYLTQLLARIQPAMRATTYTGVRSAENAEFVDLVARKNVELTMGNIRKNSAVIAELERAGTVKIAGAFYDVRTGA